MSKKLLIAILAVYSLTHMSGCTSSSPKEEAEVAASDDGSFAEEGDEDFESADNSTTEEAPAEESGDEVAENSDEAPAEEEGDLAENAEEETPSDEAAPEEEMAAGETGEKSEEVASNDEGNDEDEFPEEAPDEQTQVAESEAPTDEKVFTADNGSTIETPTEETASTPDAPVTDTVASSEPTPSEEPAAPAVYAPYLKVKDAPFEMSGTLMNRVYLARKGDTMKSVSEKIYGTNRASDLKKWNPSLKAKLNAGNKVYYNSPTQPQDSSKMLTYYEDVGIQPQVYTANQGDNIRELGKTLLGDGNGWKELWATNADVESKGALPPGTQLRYWPADAAAPTMAATAPTAPVAGAPTADPTVAANQPAADPTMNPTMAPPAVDPVTGQQPGDVPPPGQAMAANDPAAQASPSDIAPPPVAGSVDANPPAPPPAADPIKKKAPATAEVGDANQDMTMMLGLGGVALILVAGLFMMMKRRRAAAAVDFSQTQV